MKSVIGSVGEALVAPLANPAVPRSERVLEVFLRVGSAEVDELSSRLDQADLAGLKRVAHRLKGGCQSIGADRLSLLCELLQRAAEERDLAQATALLAEVVRAFALTRVELEGELRRLPSP